MQVNINKEQKLKVTSPVECLCISDDYSKLFSGQEDGSIRIYDLNCSGDYHLSKMIFEGHSDAVKTITYNNKNENLVTGSLDKKIKIWRKNVHGNWISHQQLDDHMGKILVILLNSETNEMFSASTENLIFIWKLCENTKKYEKKQILEGHKDSITSIQYNGTSRKLFSSSLDSLIICWRLNKENDKYEKSSVYKGHKLGVESLIYCRLSDTFFSGCKDSKIRVWKEWEDGDFETIQEFKEPNYNWVQCLQYAREQRLLISAGYDGTVRLWIKNVFGRFKCAKQIIPMDDWIYKFVYLERQKVIISCGVGESIMFTDVSNWVK